MKIERITLLVKEELEKLLEGLDRPGPGFKVGEKPTPLRVQMISVDHLVANEGLFSGILEAFAEPGSERAKRGARYRNFDPKNPFDSLKNPQYPAKTYDFEEKPTTEQVVSMIADLAPHQRKDLIMKLDQKGIY